MITEIPTGRYILNLPMQPNDAEAATIREYLVAALTAFWEEDLDLSGKPSFGESGWGWTLHEALVRADLIRGTFDDAGDLFDADMDKGRKLIASAIQALGEER